MVSNLLGKRDAATIFVIAGLGPAIPARPQLTMDHRVKRGGDD
jgi:hypothetical protein